MKRSGDIPWGQWRLGLLIFVGLALFVWASIRGGAAFFERRSEIKARFQSVNGLTQGSPIWFRGVEVGSVKDLRIRAEGDSSFVEVVLSVKDEVAGALHADAEARISAINFFGEKYIDLRPGTPGAGSRDPAAWIASSEPADFDELLRRGEMALGSVKRMSEDLETIMARVRRGDGTLGAFVNERTVHDDLSRLARDADALSRSLNETQKETAQALASAATQLDSLLARVNRGEGTLGHMARDERLYASLAGAAGGADSTLGMVAGGSGSVGLLMRDAQAYEEFTRTLQRLNELLDDIQRNPKRYFKFSVF